MNKNMNYAVAPKHAHRHGRRPFIHHTLIGGGHASNVRETEDAFYIDLIAPGRDKSLFEVGIKDSVLTLNIKSPESTKEGTVVQEEFKLSEASRKFRLPRSVDSEAITASYLQGILTLTLPKKEEAQPRKIEIQ